MNLFVPEGWATVSPFDAEEIETELKRANTVNTTTTARREARISSPLR